MALKIQEAQEQITCGIWAGRFQFVHNGHKSVFISALKGFREQFVAIVNPNPQELVDAEHVRFDPRLNPFNYFKRMLIWKTIADTEGQDITIVPCWHARRSVNLENEFLPHHSVENPGRCWIVPIGQDDNERRKEADLTSIGEIVCDSNYGDESLNCRGITASLVRQYFENERWEKFNESVPLCVQELTRSLVNNNDPYEYRIVPIIDDMIDFSSLQNAMNWAKQDKKRLVVIAVSVGVETCEHWWFKPARRLKSHYTFYQKAKSLKVMFNNLHLSNYLITPFFIQENDFGRIYIYSEAFLPPSRNSKWIINNNLNYSYGLIARLGNQNIEYISNEFVDEDNLQSFIMPEIEQIPRGQSSVERETIKLKGEIEYFLSLHSFDDEEQLCKMFENVPAELDYLLTKIKYNVISITEATKIYKKIKNEWDNK